MRSLAALLALTALFAAAAANARSIACGGRTAQRIEAQANALSLDHMKIDLFGREEAGWSIYAPTIEREIRTNCAPTQPAFAAALARWQSVHQLTPSGVMNGETLKAMKTGWQERRPFYALRDKGDCPAPPAQARLAEARPDELLEGSKPVSLRRGALRAWRRMAAAARRQERAIRNDPQALKLFSGYRDPEADAARCAAENNCQGLVRASCSAHRTGLALDLMVGAAPSYSADSTANANRLYQSKTPAYRWLVRHAARYGFVNYVFEPWHWEWTGQKP